MAIDPAAVALVLDSDEDADLTQFITTAQAVLDYHFASSDIDAGILAQIGVYLAAHFATVTDPTIRQVTLNSSSMTFSVPHLTSGLNATTFGQQAVALDYTRVLATLTIPLRASIVIL